MEIQKPELFNKKTSANDSLIPETETEATSRQSPFMQRLQWLKNNYARIQLSAVTVELDTTSSARLPLGSVVSAVEAKDWSPAVHNCDIRPRLLDKATGAFRLIDSGSQITATRRQPDDKIDPTLKLVAVNGSQIQTYGIRQLNIKIGRKSYEIPAVICDIQQDILGMDFLNKYKLGFEWDDFDQTELYLVDKKSKIKAELQMVTVPSDLQRVHYLSHKVAIEFQKQDTLQVRLPNKNYGTLGNYSL